MKRFWRFLRMSHLEKRLFWQAIFWLTFAKIVIKFTSFNILKQHLGEVTDEAQAPLTEAQQALSQKIKTAINRAARTLPFHCQCLVTAICAHKLLAGRDVPCRLFLGVKKDQDALAAHAWVTAGDRYITGRTRESYTAVKVFQ